MKKFALLLTLVAATTFSHAAAKQQAAEGKQESAKQSVLEQFTQQARAKDEEIYCPTVMRWAYQPSTGACRALSGCEAAPAGWQVLYSDCSNQAEI